jgi:hypothetical protein
MGCVNRVAISRLARAPDLSHPESARARGDVAAYWNWASKVASSQFEVRQMAKSSRMT